MVNHVCRYCITLNLMESNFSERTERMSCELELRGFKKLLCVVDVNWIVLVPNFDPFCILSTFH